MCYNHPVMETLYRKYRPQRFADLVGQEPVRKTLENQLKSNSIGHAYLFTGVRGVGKTTTARLLAKAVNCLKRGEDGEPCNTCASCMEIVAGRSLDVIEMDAASHTGVDNVREHIIDSVRFAPTQRTYKVFIIDEVHMLSTNAFNALLKTLEEPPSHALFILATTEIHKVPDTIISRCQRFDFRRISTDVLIARLNHLAQKESVKVDAEVMEEISRLSEGSQRDAESLLAQVMSIGDTEITMETAGLVLPTASYGLITELLTELSQANAGEALATVAKLVEGGGDVDRFVADTIRFVRRLLLAVLGDAESVLSVFPTEIRATAIALTQTLSSADLLLLLENFSSAQSRRMTIVQLPLEMAVVEFCLQKKSPDVIRTVSAVVADVPEATSAERAPVFVTSPVSELEVVSSEELEALGVDAEIALPVLDESGKVTFRTVEGKWDEVFRQVCEAQASLGFLLKSSKLIAVEAGEVKLGFQFKFHAETMNADKNRRKLEDVLQKVLGSKMRVVGQYVHADTDEIVGELLDELHA